MSGDVLTTALDIPGSLSQAGAMLDDAKLRLNAVKISEYVESLDNPELTGFLYPETPSIEAAVEEVAAAIALADKKRSRIPDLPTFEITPNIVLNFVRAVDKAVAALQRAELAVEVELGTRQLEAETKAREAAHDADGAKQGTAGAIAASEAAVVDNDASSVEVLQVDQVAVGEDDLDVLDSEAAEGRTIWDAVERGDTRALRSYLKVWGPVKVFGLHNKAPAEGGRTVLHTASWWGRLAVIELLVSVNGFDANAIDLTCSRTTPLMEAARAGHADVCRALVHYGAKRSSVDVQGSTALHWAARRGHVGVIYELLRLGDALKLGRRHGDPNDLLLLSPSPADLEQTFALLEIRDAKSHTALDIASTGTARAILERALKLCLDRAAEKELAYLQAKGGSQALPRTKKKKNKGKRTKA